MDPIQIQIVMEVLGRPVSNVQQALASVVTKLASEKGVKVLERKFHEAAKVPNAEDLYTSFVEVTLEIDSLDRYFAVLFSYMPSHVELIYPERITLDNAALNQFANQLMQRLHNYDAIVKNVMMERDVLLKRIEQDAPHLLSHPDITSKEANPPKAALSPKKTKNKSGKKTKKKQVSNY